MFSAILPPGTCDLKSAAILPPGACALKSAAFAPPGACALKSAAILPPGICVLKLPAILPHSFSAIGDWQAHPASLGLPAPGRPPALAAAAAPADSPRVPPRSRGSDELTTRVSVEQATSHDWSWSALPHCARTLAVAEGWQPLAAAAAPKPAAGPGLGSARELRHAPARPAASGWQPRADANWLQGAGHRAYPREQSSQAPR
jgi:hypothetical protein